MKILRLPLVSRGASCAVLLFAFALAAVRLLSASDKSAPAPVAITGNLSQDLLGVWVYVGEPGKMEDPPAKGGFIKLRTAHHWAAISIDSRTGLVESTHGGTWRADGNVYQETVEYGGEHHAQIMNGTYKWKIRLAGDAMTMSPVDNPWNEVWRRVK